MTLQELKEWKTGAHFVDSTAEYDSSTNCWETRIYEKDGKYYSIEYLNGYPCERYVSEKGYIRDEYEVREVRKKTRTIKETYYE